VSGSASNGCSLQFCELRHLAETCKKPSLVGQWVSLSPKLVPNHKENGHEEL